MDEIKNSEESRHYEQIWKMAILPVRKVVFSESDLEFRQRCSLQSIHTNAWKKRLLKEYRRLRESLKEVCYGDEADIGRLDGRKIAAVICNALIREKAFKFDTTQAEVLMEEKDKTMTRVGFNLWITQNIYLNYKLAYYASLQLVYLTLLHDLRNTEIAESLYGPLDSDTLPLVVALNEVGHLFPYPSPPDADSFDVNIIIGMARADLTGRDFDMFLFAMQLYQLEMYTIGKLKTK